MQTSLLLVLPPHSPDKGFHIAKFLLDHTWVLNFPFEIRIYPFIGGWGILLSRSLDNSIRLRPPLVHCIMYPGHTGTSTHSATGTTRNTTVATATRRPPVQKMAPTILPQPVLLVGYTPDGSPILMSNPNQGSVSSLMSTSSAASTSTGRQIHTLNSSLYSTSVSTSGAPYAGPSGPMTNNDYLSTIFQDKQPVMAVATTVLGPDGKSCVALVKPTSHSGASWSHIPMKFSFYDPLSTCVTYFY